MSDSRKKFLRSYRKNKLIIKLSQICLALSFLLVWEVLAKYEIINSFITSSPSKIVVTIINLFIKDNLIYHIFITLSETLIAFIITLVISLTLSILIYKSTILDKIIDPYLTVINSLPKVALGPIIIIWAGAGMKSIILMALFISVIITIINVYQSFNETDYNKIKLMKTFNATRFQIYTKLILPNSLKTIISSLKINISMSLIGVIMGEFLVSKKGIGYLIMYGSQVFNLDLVITGIFILCVVASLMYYIILYIEKKLIKN